ncbi:MAG: AmmeMemoRadiSam system protein A [Mariprofundus sp.]|nr:AmmeMemoRadiSam system protein A [Mariprofundus sp.]
MMNKPQGDVLIALARQAIADKLEIRCDAINTDHDDWLTEHVATFVTLTIYGNLRGCIGTLEAYRPLIDDVRSNAEAAAFHDPRFAPLSRGEYASVDIEVSVLSRMQNVEAQNEQIAIATIRPGIDGVVLQYGPYKATFLPQVWDQLPDPQQFFAHLKQKAGLSIDFWHPELQLSTYQVNKFHEHNNEHNGSGH